MTEPSSSSPEQPSSDPGIPPDWGRALFQNAGHSMYVTDVDGTILHVNSAFEEITGYSREEAVGENPRILQSGKHTDSFYEDLWETILSGQVWRDEILNRRKNGELYYVEQTISPIRDESSNLEGFVAINIDVTERHTRESFIERLFSKREKEHNQLSRELHDRVGQKLLYALLKLKQDLPGKDVDESDSRREIVGTLEEVLDHIRDLSSLLRPVSLDHATLLEALQSHAERLRRQHDVEIQVEGTGTKREPLAAERRRALYRIAQEALLNALEHGDAKQVGVVINRLPERTVLRVEDDGSGFDTGILKELEPRGKLGIQSMKERTRLLDGSFTLDSSPGQGTRVKVEIPR